jgi:hypothetical protein
MVGAGVPFGASIVLQTIEDGTPQGRGRRGRRFVAGGYEAS